MGGNARLRIGPSRKYVFTDARLVFVERRCRPHDVREDAARWQVGVVASALSVARFGNATGDGVSFEGAKTDAAVCGGAGLFPNIVCSSEQIL